MELRLLRYFLTVAKEQSFTKAAEQLHITQPTLSRQMAAFEEEVVLNICRTLADMDLKVCNVEIRFTRRNYENILQKAQVLDLMLKNNKIHPRLAFEHCGLFVDSDLAYTLSAEYAEEQEQKAQELFEQQQRMKQEGNDDDSGNNEGNGGADGKSAETREQSGNTD